MKLRRSRTAELSVPDGYTGLTRVPAADPVVAFHAVQEGVGRPVLVFVAPHAGDFDRFRAILANLPQRPGLATVYDAGRTKAGHPYVATAAPGRSLGDRIDAGGPLPPPAAVAFTVRLAEALSAAHDAGIVHGDIRPEYVWLADDAAPELTGFGLFSPAAPPLTWAPTGCVHLAPEVLEGAEPGVAADVYALTSVLATAIAGEPMHLAAAWAGQATLIQRKLEPLSAAITRPDVPDGLLAVVRRGMAADPAARYASAADLAAALRGVQTAETNEIARPAEAAPTFTPPDPAAEKALTTAPGDAVTETPGPLVETLPGLELETAEPGGPGARRVLVVAAAALAIVAVTGVIGLLGRGRSQEAAAQRPAPTPAAPTPAPSHPAPTATRQAPVLSKLELTRYQPAKLKAVPAPQQAVLTWSLPPDARRDGAGIIIRRQPADDQPVAALSRTNGRLPETYVAVPLKPGQQYCFLVGVLLRRADGGTALAQSGPVCAMPR
ncbi:hypothetical protein OG417_53795 [Actinoallomurus sp. NBC_01490]|uniref:protein kinase domain-containing protein n=1 Tax=Actinoallomurus sp. NBC_01490 TaxID=2903557 RepID=UPI002E32111B|nr:hypothetical protein [Actinoallomurus sp. NBC_01490]